MGNLKKTVIKSITKEAQLKKKASNLLVDNFGIGGSGVSIYGGTEYAINSFKGKYPTIIDGGVENAKGTMEWDIATTWTGIGFKFEPYINYIKLSATATIWFIDEKGEETYKEEEIDIDTKEYTIKVECNKTDENEVAIEFKSMEVDLKGKEITVYFNV